MKSKILERLLHHYYVLLTTPDEVEKYAKMR